MCGLPTSWAQSAASVGFPSKTKIAAWSTCSKFIAVAWGIHQYGGTVEILDAGTLEQLSILPLYKQSITKCLIFSPDTSLLTWIGWDPNWIISWDVQTGVLVSTISLEPLGNYHSVTYSTCGTMIGLLSRNASTSTISTYNILSGTHIYSHSVKGPGLKVWTHDECLQYAVLESKTIIIKTIVIWEVGFMSTHTPAKVESLPLPVDFYSEGMPEFYPNISLVYFSRFGKNHIWDTKCSKYLPGFKDTTPWITLSSSSDGHFLVSRDGHSRTDIWKESPTGYILHQRLISIGGTEQCISPTGEFILTWSNSAAQLWHIRDSSISNSTTPTLTPQSDPKFRLLVFSPDKALAAVTKKHDNAVTVLDLKSGVPRLIIDTGMDVHGLGMAGGTIMIVGYDKSIHSKRIVTWNIPARGQALILKTDIGDSIKSVTFDSKHIPQEIFTSVSPGLHHIVSVELNRSKSPPVGLFLYDALTGKCHTSVPRPCHEDIWFTQDGCRVWCVDEGWKIIKDGESSTTELEHLGSTKYPPGELPWQCPPNYKVTDGWIFHSSRKRLLWLPPQWWPDQYDRVWGGQFLALVNRNLSEALILELE